MAETPEKRTPEQAGMDALNVKAIDTLTAAGLLKEGEVQPDVVVAALNEALEQIGKAARDEAKAQDLTMDEAVAAGVFDHIAKDIDWGQFTSEVQRRSAEIAEARSTPRGGLPEAKTQANFQDAGRAAGDVLERIQKAGGVMRYLRSSGETSMADLMRMETADPQIRLAQRANDDMLLVAQRMGLGAMQWSEQEQREMPAEKSIERFTDLNCYQGFMDAMGGVTKAMDTTTGTAWAPTVYSYDLIENVYQSTAVARLFPRAPWIGKGGTMTVPVEGTDISIYGAGEPTSNDDDPKYTASDPGLGTSVVVTAKVLAARSLWSYETEEDMIIDYVDHIRMKFTREFARTFDSALLDGDTGGTHQDTGASYNAQSAQSQFDGLRKEGLADTTTRQEADTYWNWEQVMTPALLMGKYAQGMEGAPNMGPAGGGQRLTDTVFITSHATRTKMTALRDTRNNNIFLTPRFAGDADARGRGYAVIDMLGGFQIIPSAMVRSDLTTAAIFDDSTKTHTYSIFVHAPSWHIYDKAIFNARIVDRPEVGQRVLVARMRLAFRHMRPTTSHTVGLLYNYKDTEF